MANKPLPGLSECTRASLKTSQKVAAARFVLTVVAVFFAGMTLGGLLFPRQGGPMQQIASWDATACDYPPKWCDTNQTAIAGGNELRVKRATAR